MICKHPAYEMLYDPDGDFCACRVCEAQWLLKPIAGGGAAWEPQNPQAKGPPKKQRTDAQRQSSKRYFEAQRQREYGTKGSLNSRRRAKPRGSGRGEYE